MATQCNATTIGTEYESTKESSIQVSLSHTKWGYVLKGEVECLQNIVVVPLLHKLAFLFSFDFSTGFRRSNVIIRGDPSSLPCKQTHNRCGSLALLYIECFVVTFVRRWWWWWFTIFQTPFTQPIRKWTEWFAAAHFALIQLPQFDGWLIEAAYQMAFIFVNIAAAQRMIGIKHIEYSHGKLKFAWSNHRRSYIL